MARGIRIKLRTAAEGTKVEIHLSRETLADLLEHGRPRPGRQRRHCGLGHKFLEVRAADE